jgi:hypothetical protein
MMTKHPSMKKLEEMRAACGVTIAEASLLVGCSHFTYKKLRNGQTDVGLWDVPLQEAYGMLQLGFYARVLPTTHAGRREKILGLVKLAYKSKHESLRDDGIREAGKLALQLGD